MVMTKPDIMRTLWDFIDPACMISWRIASYNPPNHQHSCRRASESQRSRHLCVSGGEKHTQMRQHEYQQGHGSYQQHQNAQRGISELPAAWKVQVVHFQEEIVHQKAVTFTPGLNGQLVHTELQFVVLAAEEYQTGDIMSGSLYLISSHLE